MYKLDANSDLPNEALALSVRLGKPLESWRKNRLFLSSGDGQLSWNELAVRMEGILHLLYENGVASEQRVLVGLGDDVRDSIIYLACLRAGVTAIMVDRNANLREVEWLIRASRPTAGWLKPEFKPLQSMTRLLEFPASLPAGCGINWPSPPSPEQIASIVFTSGTSAQPKGVQISHRALLAQMDAFTSVYAFGPESRLLNLLPFHHVDGLFRGLVAAAVHGCELHRPAPFSISGLRELLEYIGRKRITHLIVVPTMLAAITRVLGDQRKEFTWPDLQCVISSADTLNSPLWRRAEAFFGVPIVNSWGQSETVCDALFTHPGEDLESRIGTIGRPVNCIARAVNEAGHECDIDQIGELQIKGPLLMSGYFEQPEESNSAMDVDWLKTGDLVERGSEGSYRFIGRKSNIIVSKGVSVNPENIVKVLLESEKTAEACVVGLPDPIFGERIVACIVLTANMQADDLEFHELCRNELPPEKRPQTILLVEKLPRGASGKVQIEQLRLEIACGGENYRNRSVYDIAASCFGVPREMLMPQSTPFNTVAWDSVGHLEFISALEEAFGLTMSADDIIDLNSLADAECIVARHGHAVVEAYSAEPCSLVRT